MSSGAAKAIGMGAATAFPSGGAPPGAVLVGETAPIAGQIALVDNGGVPRVVWNASGQFIPANDNLTDLGDPTHRFRSLWLGTSIRNAGNLAIQLEGGASTLLTIENPTVGQVCNVSIDGQLGFGQAVMTASLATLATLGLGAPGVAGVGLQVSQASAAAVNGVRVTTAATGLGVGVQAYGGDANVDLAVSPKGATGALNLTTGGGAISLSPGTGPVNLGDGAGVIRLHAGGFYTELALPLLANRILTVPDVTGLMLVKDGATNVVAAGAVMTLDLFRDGADSTLTVENTGTGNVKIALGTTALDTVALFGTAGTAQQGAIADLPAFTDPPTAAEMAVLRAAVNGILAALRAGTGLGVLAP